MDKTLQSVGGGDCHIRQVDENTFLLYDLPKWNYEMQNRILYHHPRARITFEVNSNSLSGFIIKVEDSSLSVAHQFCCVMYLTLLGLTFFLLFISF